MNTSNRVKEIQNVRTQLLPIWGGWEGFLFNAFNCMKAYSFNGERYGYYGYDASGERTYKIDFDAVFAKVGGVITVQALNIQNIFFYPNGYMNININGEYTKHYYAGALRIASKIGRGTSGLDLCNDAAIIDNTYPDYLTDRINIQYEEMKEELTELVPGSQDILDITPIPYPDFCNIGGGGQENELFFYHPDHLGSTGMVTDNYANVTQGLFYAPFGEIISDYNSSFHNSPMPNYAFNAKELDEENGMYYYSARYYAPPTFISRDMLFEQKPWISPYTYCSNSPINKIDPTGMNDGYYLNLITGRIEYHPGNANLLNQGLVYIAGDNAKVSDIENGLKNRNYAFVKDPTVSGGFKVDTEKQYKAWAMMMYYDPEIVGIILFMGLPESKIKNFSNLFPKSATKQISVIGPRATYREFAKKIGANYLNVKDKDWTWAKNEKFLEGIVKRGDDVIFAGKFNPLLLDPKSTLAKEINYLIDKGYKWTKDFSKLIKE